MGLSQVRRIASLLFALAFVVGAQAHALSMTHLATADSTLAVTMPGFMAGDCSDCDQHDLMAKADCKATCVPVLALAPETQVEKQVHLDLASTWSSETATTRDTAPDTAPPRS